MAGDKAARNFSIPDARTYYIEAMDLIDRQSKTGKHKTDSQKRKRIAISLKWAQISHYAGPEDFILILETSLKYAREINDEPKIVHLTYWFGQRNTLVGNLNKAIEYYSQCIELAEQSGEKILLAEAYAAIGRIYFFEAEYLLANHCLEKSIPMLEGLGQQNDVAYATGFLCGSYGYTGDFEKAFTYGEQALKITEETGNLSRKANSYMWLAVGFFFQGTWEKCIDACNQAIAIAHPLGETLPIINCLIWLGASHFMNGRRKEGLLKMQEGIEMMEKSKIYVLFSMHYYHLAYCYAKAEMIEKATETANKGQEWAPKGMKGFDIIGNYALGTCMK